jgi:ATP-dependent helicase/nuclease subunit A
LTKTFSIYRSSAGSGKTRTLAKEYLKLALQHRGYYFRHILAVTFTNKSTQEMKDRILTYLDDFAKGRPNELAHELKKELGQDDNTFQERSQDVQREILHNYSQFSISTIDAFFQRVIRSFTREAGLMGDYRLEVDQDLVLEEVIDDLIDELGSNKELTEWVVEFARDNLENERAWDVRLNLREFSEQIFKEEFKAIEDDLFIKTKSPDFFRNLLKDIQEKKWSFIKFVVKRASEGLALIHQQGLEVGDFKYSGGAGYKFFNNLKGLKSVAKFEEPGVQVSRDLQLVENWPKKDSPNASKVFHLAKEKLLPLMKEILEYREKYFMQAISAELAMNNFYSFGLIADISRKLKQYKEQNNLMLLADAPKFLNGVIQDSDTPFIYEKVGSFYRNFLIDEFQDTSGYQWKNFLPLLTNSLDQGNTSMVVGDVKQAVYRWRGGDLKLLQDQIEKQIGKDRVNVVELDTNFRSASNIVYFNNALFKSASAIVSQKTNGALPSDAFKDVAQKAVKKDGGFVQIQFVNDDAKSEPFGKQQGWKELALEQVHLQLEQLQSAGVKLSDIAILVRKNFEGQEIANHLMNYKNSDQAKPGCRYDVISNESLRLDGAASVNVLLGAMRYLQNPDDYISRAQLVYEFTRLKNSDKEFTEIFTVATPFFENNLPPAFARSKAWLKKLPLFELTETLIEIFQVGEEKGELSYLQAFQDLVLEFYTRERNDLGAFLEWWEINRMKKSLQISGEVNAVQIVTVHKSKGLQFKYILIPFCSWSMDHEFYREPLLWVKSDKSPFQDAGYVPIKYSSKMEESYFKESYEEEVVRSYLDNLNLLYVAFTRAELGLLVTAPYKTKETVSKLIYESISSDFELQKNWNESLLQWKLGELTPSSGEEKESIPSLELEKYVATRWRDKLVIKRSSTAFFDGQEDLTQERIRYGIYMHTVLSRVKYASQVSQVLDEIVAEGLTTMEDRDPLAKQLDKLLNQPQVRDWFSEGWDVRTEVPIILPEGGDHRIDRLMMKDSKAIVVDFKTGERNKRDQQQVLEYVNILRQMNFAEVEGYVLYLRDMEVLNVFDQKPKPSKRKENKDQLGLGF